MNTMEIFKSGTHTDSGGATITFSEADIAALAESYDPALSEAPLVVGHPKTDDPAWGWVKALSAKDGRLFAEAGEVDPSFAEMVRAGRYRKISVSLYSPSSPTNPKPGAWYLRHVGFLGAQPPAVKGLQPVHFAEASEEGLVTVEFGEELGFIARLIGLLRGVRDYITEKDGAEKAESVLPSLTLDVLQEGTAQALASPEANTALYSEEKDMKQEEFDEAGKVTSEERKFAEFAEREADLTQREADLTRREAEFAERERLGEARGLVNSLVAEGRITPAQSAGLAEFLAGLGTEDTFSFSEGEAEKKASPAAFMKEFLARLPKQVDFGEHSAPVDGADEMDPQEAAGRVVAFQERKRAAGIVLSTTDALAAVLAGRDKE